MNAFLALVRDVRGKLPVDLTRISNIRSDHNNWLIPGIVMAGPYPGTDGINFPSDQEAIANLRGILDDGIDVFVSLCSELPRQSEDACGTTLCTTYFPRYANYAFLTKRHALAPGRSIVYDTLEIVDQEAPTPAGTVALLTRILHYIKAGKRVFVHCAGGHGRTGTILACLLLCVVGDTASLSDVLRLVQYAHDLRRARDKKCSRSPMPPRSPNSDAQFAFVKWFAEFLRFALAV